MTPRPIVKWAGGKSQLLGELSARYPAGLGSSIRKYAEPFIGGGAVLFDILSKFDLDAVYISDANAELVNMYRAAQSNADGLIGLLKDYAEAYIPMGDEERKAFYYARRNDFNAMIASGESKSSLGAAALFIFLNKACFNGLYRVNRHGMFNVPIGGCGEPLICDEAGLRAASKALANVEIACGSYKEAAWFIDDHTFAYFDPPYRPISKTSSFTAYTPWMFDDAAQAELAAFAKGASAKGAKVMLSNSDPKNIDPSDNFFDDLYNKMRIERVCAIRSINSDGKARGKITELIIRNY